MKKSWFYSSGFATHTSHFQFTYLWITFQFFNNFFMETHQDIWQNSGKLNLKFPLHISLRSMKKFRFYYRDLNFCNIFYPVQSYRYIHASIKLAGLAIKLFPLKPIKNLRNTIRWGFFAHPAVQYYRQGCISLSNILNGDTILYSKLGYILHL